MQCNFRMNKDIKTNPRIFFIISFTEKFNALEVRSGQSRYLLASHRHESFLLQTTPITYLLGSITPREKYLKMLIIFLLLIFVTVWMCFRMT